MTRNIRESQTRQELQRLRAIGIKLSVIAREIGITKQSLAKYADCKMNLSEENELKLADYLKNVTGNNN